MACNPSLLEANQHSPQVIQQSLQVDQEFLLNTGVNPNKESSLHGAAKRHCSRSSPLLFGNPEHTPNPTDDLTLCLETKKLISNTCRLILQLEASHRKLVEKSPALEQHKLKGTFPKDLLLPKKKSLFEDEQPKVDAILQSAITSLLEQRYSETSRKKSLNLAKRAELESNFFKTIEWSRDNQLSQLSESQHEKAIFIQNRHSLNIRALYKPSFYR